MSTTQSQLTMFKISNCIYRILWLILCKICNCMDILQWLIFRFYTAIHWSHDRLRKLYSSSAKIEKTFLEHCKTKLSKIPKHLNIIVGPDDIYVNEELIKRLLAYALIMDITYLSIYDTRSLSKGKIILKNLKALNELNWNYYVWTECVHKIRSNQKILTNGLTNGHKYDKKAIQILDITPEHGREQIALVCRKLFTQYFATHHTAEFQNLFQNREHLTQHIDTKLTESLHNFPEPELCIIFNSDMYTFGLLPWQTRFTEFHLHKTGRYFNAKSFAKVLFRYSRIEQRWGK